MRANQQLLGPRVVARQHNGAQGVEQGGDRDPGEQQSLRHEAAAPVACHQHQQRGHRSGKAGDISGFTIPLERICREQLSSRASDTDALFARLAEDYQHLHEQLMRLSADIDMILMDGVMPMDKFAEDLRAYLDAHRGYLRAEREELFPLIREHFDDDDLARLAAEMPPQAESELSRLQEAYPELYSEFRDAPSPLES